MTSEPGQQPKAVIDRGQPKNIRILQREIAKGTGWAAIWKKLKTDYKFKRVALRRVFHGCLIRWLEQHADVLAETLRKICRGFALPGSATGASAYLAQHDFVHVLADYGTNLKGELEVFVFIGRADPDPKGFAWLATLIGLFETGYIADTGFFERDVRQRTIQAPGMHRRIADAILRLPEMRSPSPGFHRSDSGH